MAGAGDQFALFEAVTALAMLVRRFDFRLDPDSPPVGMTTGATIHTSAGLHMFLTPRTFQVRHHLSAGFRMNILRMIFSHDPRSIRGRINNPSFTEILAIFP